MRRDVLGSHAAFKHKSRGKHCVSSNRSPKSLKKKNAVGFYVRKPRVGARTSRDEVGLEVGVDDGVKGPETPMTPRIGLREMPHDRDIQQETEPERGLLPSVPKVSL